MSHTKEDLERILAEAREVGGIVFAGEVSELVDNYLSWQPVETAPVDGSEFLGTNDRGGNWSAPAIMSWGKRRHTDGSVRHDDNPWWRSYCQEKLAATPTMWMPTPEPPSLEDLERSSVSLSAEEMKAYILERGCDNMTILDYTGPAAQIVVEETFISAVNTGPHGIELLFDFANGKNVKIRLGPFASATRVAFPDDTPADSVSLITGGLVADCGKCLYCRLKKEERNDAK